jgi:hypothetical protein
MQYQNYAEISLFHYLSSSLLFCRNFFKHYGHEYSEEVTEAYELTTTEPNDDELPKMRIQYGNYA